MKKLNMVLKQCSKLFLLLLLLGCSDQNIEPDINYSNEFDSIINEFYESSILEFNKSDYLDKDFIKDFLKKLDPQKTVFIESDIKDILDMEI